MDEEKNPINLVLHACSLARDLEAQIPNLMATNTNVNYPRIVSHKCDEIIGVFTMAKHHLNSLHPLAQDDQRRETAASGRGKEVAAETHDDSMNIVAAVSGGEGGREDVGGGSSSSSTQQRNRRSSRKDEESDGRRRVRLAAPQIGNLEMPPEDGFTWRKYGQKEILNTKYPRSYYRCTHQKLYNCPAKKQVQRLDDDPYTFDILYRGEHTCHISSTAPTLPSQPIIRSSSSAFQNLFFPQQQPSTAVDSPSNQWLAMDAHGPSSEGMHTVFEPQPRQLYHVTSTSNLLHANDNQGASSTVGFRRDHDHDHDHEHHAAVDLLLHQHNNSLLDLAEVMFNSGSSTSSNNMDVIFSSVDHDNK